MPLPAHTPALQHTIRHECADGLPAGGLDAAQAQQRAVCCLGAGVAGLLWWRDPPLRGVGHAALF